MFYTILSHEREESGHVLVLNINLVAIWLLHSAVNDQYMAIGGTPNKLL